MIEVHPVYSLELEPGETFYAKRSHEPSGRAPHFALPRPWRGILPRILYKAWVMNAYTRPKEGGSIRFKPPEAHRFVVWRLEEGDQVCFDYRKLVGFSKSVRLKTLFSLRLSAFAMNRLLFPVAIGPGLLVMEAVGQPSIMPQEAAPESVPPSRLVAWSIDTVFELEAHGGILNDYMSPVYLKPVKSRAVIVDADDPARYTGGILRRLLGLVFPQN